LAPPRAKKLEYVATLDDAGKVGAGGDAVELSQEWTAESLLLAALLRCSTTSFRYHARRAGIDVMRSSGEARGVVTKRASDGRYAFVEIEARLDVETNPQPAAQQLAEVAAKAERDCFIGASLTAAPAYRWRANGRDL
jgi:organic hydroperoxide reductase OsmC/OhrA